MAHFAELDPATNFVKRVIVINNAVTYDENGVEHEEYGIALCKHLYGDTTKWVQTSYHGSFRRYFAGIGFTYNEEANVFVKPCPPGTGWSLDPVTLEWVQS